ncbi:MAG: prepilin-type N-terminal cleavage/methylation domain-containing protein [Candidatus Omnitrophica bacterium]|nr:prepilin-type N-terminal cleavage/methylation domain-containing protein [Candidatus Omnitrophota bacterium]
MNKTGVTLIEILVVTVIIVILVGILSFSLIQARSVFQSGDILVSLQSDARLGINHMLTDLRRTAYTQMTILQNTPSAGIDSITYHLPLDGDSDGLPDIVADALVWDTTDITISLDTATSSLIKTVNSNETVLANNVKDINFFDHNLDATLYLDELKVIMELEKTSSEGRTHNFISTSIINMRN